MVTKLFIAVAIGVAIGVSPIRNSKFVDFMIAITGG